MENLEVLMCGFDVRDYWWAHSKFNGLFKYTMTDILWDRWYMAEGTLPDHIWLWGIALLLVLLSAALCLSKVYDAYSDKSWIAFTFWTILSLSITQKGGKSAALGLFNIYLPIVYFFGMIYLMLGGTFWSPQ